MKRALLLIAIAAFTLTACRGNNSVPAGSRGTPVFLISIDTLRSDHLPAYGYAKVDTPNIDALRGDGILYEHAYSHCPLTLPSHTTVFTGMLPADSGVRDNIGFQLDDKIQTLPAVMKANGYSTGAAVSAFVLRKETGISFTTWRQQASVFACLPQLAEGQPVTNVALEAGYESVAAFTTMFRRMLGTSPRTYMVNR